MKSSFEPLQPGDVIGIAAPAGPFDAEIFNRGIATLEQMGFMCQIPAGIHAAKDFLAGSDHQRAEILHQLFADSLVKAIICARGGYGSMRLLPLLDFDLIRKHPKPLAGFSDITALLNTVADRCRIPTWHGPVVTTLADPDEKTCESLGSALMSADPVLVRPENPRILRPGKARGIMIGGNLTTLCHLIGTGYLPSLRKRILFLEEIHEAPYRIDRMLFQMKLSGVLDEVAGVVVGQFQNCGEIEIIHDLLLDAFQAPVPIMAGLDIGHGKPNLTVPIGLLAELSTDSGELRFFS